VIYYFCPFCWKELKDNLIICPFCKSDLRNFSSMPFEEKLIHALRHPVREIRKTAVFIIGLKKMSSAVKELEKILSYEEDPIMIIEILNSLKKIGTEEAVDIIERFKFHSSSLISSYVNKFLVHKPINDNN